MLERELRAHLNQAGRRRAHHLAERSTADIAVYGLRSEKLSVVENIKSFEAELQGCGFGEARVLEERHVEVLHSRSVEIAARRVARSAEGVIAEQRCIEIRLPVAGIVIQIERTRRNVRLVDTVVVHPIWLGAQQGIVAVIDQRHRETRAEARDAGEFPPLSQTIRRTQQM